MTRHYIQFLILLTLSIGDLNAVFLINYGSKKVLQELRLKRAADGNGSCVLPPSPLHGNYIRSDQIEGISSNSLVNQFTRIDFTCSPNFIINGADRSYCIEGKWTPEPPTCSQTCKSLKSSSMDYECSLNEVIIPCSTPMLAGTKADVRCKENYKAIAFKEDTITCNNDGQWQESYVICTPECGTVGKDAADEVIPWHTTIYEKVGIDTKSICSGSIVNANTIITAAHCLCNETSVKDKNAFTITINSYEKYARNLEDTILLSKIKEIVVHPGYFGEDSNQQYDIALIVLVNIIEFTPAVKPVCIDWAREGYDDNIYPGKVVQITGWTSTPGDRSNGSQMKQLDMRVISREECREWSPRSVKPFITRDKFCATYLNESAGTTGNYGEGGGIYCSHKLWGESVFYIEGIVSVKTNNSLIASTTVVKYLKFLKNNNVHKNIESFECKSGDLINFKDICDGIIDCEDSSDEADELCQVSELDEPVGSSKPLASLIPSETTKPLTTTEPSKDLKPSESSIPLTSEAPLPTLQSVEATTPIEVLVHIGYDNDSASTVSSQTLESTDVEDQQLDRNDTYIDCNPPDELQNGAFNIEVTENFPFPRKVIQYICDFPYILIGDSSQLCSAGKWENEPPLCLRDPRIGDDALIPLDCSEVKSNVSGMYEIWPKLTEKPFSVYCDFEYLNSKWTVLQKRFDGSVDFGRSYKEYIDGFGDLNGEHWLGLLNIYKITKYGDYELYVLLTDFDNQTRFARYEAFYVEQTSTSAGPPYSHIEGGTYVGTAGNGLGSSIGAVFCTHDSNKDSYDRDQICFKNTEFGWWYNDIDTETYGPPSNLNGPYLNETFARNTTGTSWGTWHQNCSLKSTQMMVRRLSDNYNISGAINNIYPEDCGQVESNVSGVFIIQPIGAPHAFNAFCDISASAKWTVFQNRIGNQMYFGHYYKGFQFGFGDLEGEHWLGLERIYQLTRRGNYELRIQLTDNENATRVARYADFSIGSVDEGYRLMVSQYRGNAGDSLTSHDGLKFSSRDNDVDTSSGNCASQYIGAWWYHDCFDSDLNGDAIVWGAWHGLEYSLSASRMSIRKRT